MPYHTSYLTEYVHFAVPNGKGGGIDILIGGAVVACLSGNAKVQRRVNKVDCTMSCRASGIRNC
jgi:hypothetical protein